MILRARPAALCSMTNFASFLAASLRLGARLNEAATSAKPHRFTRNETYQGRLKPAFQSDREASEAAHSLLSEKIIHPCPRHKALEIIGPDPYIRERKPRDLRDVFSGIQ
jgi:hypothetical protein